jgi:flagellar export protein FliJ
MAPTFALQNVLNLRHDRVELLEVQLGRLVKLQLEAQNFLQGLIQARSVLVEKLSAAQSGEMDLFEITMLRANLQNADSQIELVERELARITNEVNAKRIQVIKAKQEEETLQILKRKGIEVFNAEQNRLETKNQDDIYIAQAFRQRGQEA